jgi:hypothetical protein
MKDVPRVRTVLHRRQCSHCKKQNGKSAGNSGLNHKAATGLTKNCGFRAIS